MLKRGFPVVAASAFVLMLASGGAGRAQMVGVWGGDYYPGYPFGFIPTAVAVDPMTYVAFYPPIFPPNAPVASPAPADQPATIEVVAPPDTVLTFDGHRTVQTGPYRHFTTPPLVPGAGYHYTVEATFTQDGEKVTQTRRVAVSAGGRTSVAFPVAK